MKLHRLFPISLAIVLVLGLALSACAPAPSGEADSPEAAAATGDEMVTLRYSLWDANQLPAYEVCAEKFTELNPNISVEIEQSGWGDYWPDLQTASEWAPRRRFSPTISPSCLSL